MKADTAGGALLPDYASPPGATLAETIEALGLSQADLAERTGRPKKTINEIIKGKAAITPETALQLEQTLGVAASFWNSLEQNYRTALARLEERKRLAQSTDWLRNFPVKAMIDWGWIPSNTDKVDKLRSLLSFFGVVSPEVWDDVWSGMKTSTAFRQSKVFSSHFGSVAAWLRRGELEARSIDCAPYDATRFRKALEKIRLLSPGDPKEFCQEMQKVSAKAGVAVVFVEELPQLRVCGAARWLTPTKALIILSLYYKKEDHFWFSFFHEAAHVLLHGKREIFVDEKIAGDKTEQEENEANQFAAEHLIPTNYYSAFVGDADFSRTSIVRFAEKIGIAPGIVVGRLQHDGQIGFNERNDLRRSFVWEKTTR